MSQQLTRNLVYLTPRGFEAELPLAPGLFRQASLRISPCQRKMDLEIRRFKSQRRFEVFNPALCGTRLY